MLTDTRLMKAYINAKVEFFDENSRYIIFSDCHRGDNSLSDEFSRNQNIYLYAMNYYYYNGYTYVEAGDGDELSEHTRFRTIRLAHSDIFITLKKFHDEGRMVMLYGNHNMFIKNPEYVKKHYYHYFDEYIDQECSLFDGLVAHEALLLKNKFTGQEILTVHGHQGDLMNDQLWYFSMLLVRFFWRIMHMFGFRNPSSPARNEQKRHKIEKNFKKSIEKRQIMLICGHTHRPKFPRFDDLPYFNAGCCIHPRGITGIEILDGMIMLVEWRIRTNREGVLKISRKVIRGPELIERFDFGQNNVEKTRTDY